MFESTELQRLRAALRDLDLCVDDEDSTFEECRELAFIVVQAARAFVESLERSGNWS